MKKKEHIARLEERLSYMRYIVATSAMGEGFYQKAERLWPLCVDALDVAVDALRSCKMDHDKSIDIICKLLSRGIRDEARESGEAGAVGKNGSGDGQR